jgi:hypothetical protein
MSKLSSVKNEMRIIRRIAKLTRIFKKNDEKLDNRICITKRT